ncbi:hypothetical protein HUU05_14765 [candidate division KSB1 bacterium]|nr:hypothetical protein [candidate division KSB1 bacterium]
MMIEQEHFFCARIEIHTHAVAHLLGIARDQKSQSIRAVLQYDLLLLTEGVSMGDLDLVEDVFAEFGSEVFFNKVAVKPGKPVVFARARKTLVFGLPDNPVSVSTNFDLLVRPAICRMMGNAVYQNQIVGARKLCTGVDMV